MGRPVHFEIHADDPQRAQKFYAGVLGWRFEQWGDKPYWMVYTGADGQPGINGGLLPRQGGAPAEGAPVNAFPCTVEVPNLDESLRQVEVAGGHVVGAKDAVPGVGWLAYAKDTEGNIFGLMESDETVTAPMSGAS